VKYILQSSLHSVTFLLGMLNALRRNVDIRVKFAMKVQGGSRSNISTL
jgi:hypothetical protein